MLRVLLKVRLPALAVPRVLGIDGFALRRGSVYATVLIDAQTGRRVDVVPAAPLMSRRSGCGATRESRSCAVTGRVPTATLGNCI
jgi:hypothetical protein